MSKLLTTKDLCEMYQVTRTTIETWRKNGMPCVKLGRTIRFDLEKIEEWFEAKK